MRTIFLSLFSIITLSSQAQQKETYYNDYYLTKHVKENKAKFKKIETTAEDGTLNLKIFSVKENCIIKEENYLNNIPVGVWNSYTPTCTLYRTRDFSNIKYSNEPLEDLYTNKTGKENYTNYEKATFGETEKSIFQYGASILKMPVETSTGGTVIIQFLITKDGSTKPILITRGVNPYIDYEVWKLIEEMPKWKPAKKDGQPIDSYFLLPLKFI